MIKIFPFIFILSTHNVFAHDKLDSFDLYQKIEQSTVRINKIANVKVYDITGKVTLEAKQVNIIDVSALTPGVYSLHVEINSRTLKYKIIKQ